MLYPQRVDIPPPTPHLQVLLGCDSVGLAPGQESPRTSLGAAVAPGNWCEGLREHQGALGSQMPELRKICALGELAVAQDGLGDFLS